MQLESFMSFGSAPAPSAHPTQSRSPSECTTVKVEDGHDDYMVINKADFVLDQATENPKYKLYEESKPKAKAK